jgi:flagellar biosynthesis protein FlhG
MTDQAHKLRELAARARATPSVPEETGSGRVLAIASGKGGVGKTNLAANLGAVLARTGHPVTVIDADFGLANLDILLNLNPTKNLGHVFRGEADAAEVVVEVASMFHVIPGASGVEALADLDETQRAELLRGLAPLTGNQEFVLIDTAAGIGRQVVDLCLAAGEVLLVTDPEPTSLTDAYGLVKVLRTRAPAIRVELVVNSAVSAEEGQAVHAKLNQVMARFLGGGLNYLGHIVRDECVGRSAQRQMPFVTAYPRCPAAGCVAELARAVLRGHAAQGGGTRGFWNRLMERSLGS